MNRIEFPRLKRRQQERRGVVIVVAVVCLAVCMMFTAFSIDVGHIAQVKTEMQNSVDAAALAAAMEITAAVENADENVEDILAYAQGQARLKAAEVAASMGVYIDPDADVSFGKRSLDQGTGEWETVWGESPSNVVRVIARRDNDNVNAPDGKLRLSFAQKKTALRAKAVAFVEPRDIVSVLDFSRSMNFDSYFADEFEDQSSQLPQEDIEANLHDIWEDLGSPTFGSTMPFIPDWVTIPSLDNEIFVTWRGAAVDIVADDYDDSSDFQEVTLIFDTGDEQTFTPSSASETFAGTGAYDGFLIVEIRVRDDGADEYFDFYNDNHIKRGLGLVGVDYPYPVGEWSRYFQMCRDHADSTAYHQPEIFAKGYGRKFGFMTFIHYILRFEPGYWETPVLWKTRHYPFHAVKEGHALFCDFLSGLSFDDRSGLVSYDTSHRIETTLNEAGMPAVDISDKPMTDDYDALKTIMHYKQCTHYSDATNLGGGLKDAKLLLDTEGRSHALPTILLMTDGNANAKDAGDDNSLPAGWDWDELFDYDNDGVADFTSAATGKQRYVLKIAKQCVDAGYTIHTMSVGADADDELMQAIAHLGGGVWLDIPGGTSTSEMQEEVERAFNRIASMVPPARLLSSDE